MKAPESAASHTSTAEADRGAYPALLRAKRLSFCMAAALHGKFDGAEGAQVCLCITPGTLQVLLIAGTLLLHTDCLVLSKTQALAQLHIARESDLSTISWLPVLFRSMSCDEGLCRLQAVLEASSIAARLTLIMEVLQDRRDQLSTLHALEKGYGSVGQQDES